jgi:hypothetical protein
MPTLRDLTHNEALEVVVPLSAQGRKQLLEVLCEEMDSDDMTEILEKNGFSSID